MTGALVDLLDEALRGGHAPELDARAAGLARSLVEGGAEPSEPVIVTIANRPHDIASLLGLWRARMVPVHASSPPAAVARVREAVGARWTIDADGIHQAGVRPRERPLLRDAALIIFTSGSTGTPKGVVIGHARFAGKLAALQRLLAFASSDVVVVPLQLTFIFGLWASLLAVLARARLVLVPGFSLPAMAEALGAGATIAAVVPTMLRSMLAATPPPAPALRSLLTGGEPLGDAPGGRIRAIYPQAGIFDLYGSTETGSCDLCLSPADQPAGLGTIGRPTEQVSARIIGDDGSPARPGEAGELQIKTPFGMLGYLDAPGVTAAAFDDGYFRTGDMARVTPGGLVELVGRRKDFISRGANKIAPLELDFLFASHPDVEAALCAGVPDERLGEAIHLMIMPRPGARPDAERLREWAATRIERYKLPDAIHVVDALPLGRTGKTDRAGVADFVRGLRRMG